MKLTLIAAAAILGLAAGTAYAQDVIGASPNVQIATASDNAPSALDQATPSMIQSQNEQAMPVPAAPANRGAWLFPPIGKYLGQ